MIAALDLKRSWNCQWVSWMTNRLRVENLRIARHLCCCCVPIIDGEVEAGSCTAGRDEAIAVADLSFWRSAVQQGSVVQETMCTTHKTL